MILSYSIPRVLNWGLFKMFKEYVMRFAEPVKFLFLPEMGLSSSQASTKQSPQYVLMRVDFLHNVVSALKGSLK